MNSRIDKILLSASFQDEAWANSTGFDLLMSTYARQLESDRDYFVSDQYILNFTRAINALKKWVTFGLSLILKDMLTSSSLEKMNQNSVKNIPPGDTCPICSDTEDGQNIIQLFCKRWYHSECFRDYIEDCNSQPFEYSEVERNYVCRCCKQKIPEGLETQAR